MALMHVIYLTLSIVVKLFVTCWKRAKPFAFLVEKTEYIIRIIKAPFQQAFALCENANQSKQILQYGETHLCDGSNPK